MLDGFSLKTGSGLIGGTVADMSGTVLFHNEEVPL
jgi:hypothetical protein